MLEVVLGIDGGHGRRAIQRLLIILTLATGGLVYTPSTFDATGCELRTARLALVGGVWIALAGIACSGDAADREEGSVLRRRVIEPRLSIGTRWAPCAEATETLAFVPCQEFLPAAERSAEGPKRRVRSADPPNQRVPVRPHEIAALLSQGATSSLTRAIGTLRLASAATPDDSKILNDLAAALFVRAQRNSDPVELVHALGAVERAARLAPNDAAVLFNEALIVDRLHLVDEASSAWGRYLDLDTDSEWAREARLRLGALRPPAQQGLAHGSSAASDSESLRDEIQETLLADWARSAEQDTGVARPLAESAYEAALRLRMVTGDPLLVETIGTILGAYESGDVRRLRHLAAGHLHYSVASDLVQKRRYASAVEAAQLATKELSLAESPFRVWATILELRCAFQRQAYAEVVSGARGALAAVEVGRPSAFRAKLWWLIGSSSFGRGELHKRQWPSTRRAMSISCWAKPTITSPCLR